jgi:RNA polymerase sigma-70 factor (ECF subfamily)
MATGRASAPRQGAQVHVLPARFASDAALCEAALARHPAAARELWDRFSTLVRGLLRRTLGRDDVDDQVQDTFLRLFRLLGRLREPDKLRSFVVGIAIRVAREELRRRRVRSWLSLRPPPECEAVATPSSPEAADALRRLEALLDRVDADARIVFVLRFVEDVPTVEIADALGCSLATAKRRVKRAHERIARAAALDPVLCEFVAAGAEDGDG